ncbi:MAG TPA: hypothetical protein VMR50_04520 [Myxococcota bacterium]|nr:hypothetical protein [Myxococcota bacterium]
MKTSNLRALRLSLFALLVCGAFSAGTAHAQWSSPVCADPNDVLTSFSNYNFNGMAKCESLCRSMGSLCRSLMRDQASCQQTSWKGYFDLFGHIECDAQATAADRKACNAEINGEQKSNHDDINSTRDSFLDDCNTNQATCIMDCAIPPA